MSVHGDRADLPISTSENEPERTSSSYLRRDAASAGLSAETFGSLLLADARR
jgi:hypothetical protein